MSLTPHTPSVGSVGSRPWAERWPRDRAVGAQREPCPAWPLPGPAPAGPPSVAGRASPGRCAEGNPSPGGLLGPFSQSVAVLPLRVRVRVRAPRPPVALGPGSCSHVSCRPFGRPCLPDGSDGAVVRGMRVRVRVCRRGCFGVPGAHLRPEVPRPAVAAAVGAAAHVSSDPRWAAGGPSVAPAAAPAATFP